MLCVWFIFVGQIGWLEMFPTPKLHPSPLTVFGPHLSSPPPSQCLLCANSCLVLFCCLCQAPWWTIDCSSGWVQPQQLSSCLSLFLSLSLFILYASSSLHVFLSPSLIIQLSPPEVSAFCILSLLSSLSFSPLLFLSHPYHPPYLLLHHCCLMPACMKAADWSHRWTEKLRFRAESQTNKMLMNDNVTATLNGHFYDSLYLCLSLLENCFLFMILFILVLCGYADSQFEKTGSFFQSCFILLHVKWWQLWALLFYL